MPGASEGRVLISRGATAQIRSRDPAHPRAERRGGSVGAKPLRDRRSEPGHPAGVGVADFAKEGLGLAALGCLPVQHVRSRPGTRARATTRGGEAERSLSLARAAARARAPRADATGSPGGGERPDFNCNDPDMESLLSRRPVGGALPAWPRGRRRSAVPPGPYASPVATLLAATRPTCVAEPPSARDPGEP